MQPRPLLPSLSLVSWRLLALLALLAPGVSAQDLCTGLVTDKAPHPMSGLARPAPGEAVTDPEFGTTIRRITAAPPGGVIKPMYSTISAWNADETLLILYKVGSGHQLHDGRTYQLIGTLDIDPADIEQVYWHTTDPDILFYVSGNRFIRYHVSNDARDTLATFSFCSAAGGGPDPMYISWDSARIGLGCESERFIYDMSSNTVVGHKTMGGGVPQVAPSGDLAYLDGTVVNANLDAVRTLDLGNPWDHASLGRTADGHDAYFGAAYDAGALGSGVGSLVLHDMTDASSRVVVGPSTGYPYPPSGTHVSAMSHRRPGWVALSIEGHTAGQGVLDNELVLANTAAGGSVCRIGHHRSYGGQGSQGYWAEPHAVLSPSGTRVLFGSDWGNSGTVDAYVVELPGYGLDLPDFDGDGRADILWRHDGGDLGVWFMDGLSLLGATELTAPSYPDGQWQIRGIGDFNGDGEDDILWSHEGGSLYVWFMDGTTNVGGSYLNPARAGDTGWQVRGVGDLNGDGQPDVLWRHQSESLYVWFMNGPSLLSGTYLTPGLADPAWRVRGIGDFDGDGQPDILWHHDEGSLYLWLMEGTTLSSGTYLTPGIVPDTDWQIERVADADGDGLADILWQHQAERSLYMWFMAGARLTSGSYLTPSGASADWSVVPR